MMKMYSDTGASDYTTFYEDIGSGAVIEVYPCRCGVTHRGVYKIEDYQHHNHNHEVILLIAPGQGICVDCGAVFETVLPEGPPET